MDTAGLAGRCSGEGRRGRDVAAGWSGRHDPDVAPSVSGGPRRGRARGTSRSPCQMSRAGSAFDARRDASSTASGSDLLTHEQQIRSGEHHDAAGDQHDQLPPGEHQALVERQAARQGRSSACTTTIPVVWRDGLSSTPVASLYSWSGESRRTFSSRRALASTSSVVGVGGHARARVGDDAGDQPGEQREHEPDRRSPRAPRSPPAGR